MNNGVAKSVFIVGILAIVLFGKWLKKKIYIDFFDNFVYTCFNERIEQTIEMETRNKTKHLGERL